MVSHWYVTETKPNSEASVVRHLARQGFETFLPVEKRVRIVNFHKVEVSIPLFPRYLFVELDLKIERWRAVCSTYGVHRLLGSGPETPISLPEGTVERWRAYEPPVAPALMVGDLVRITGGALADQVGKIKELPSVDGRRKLLFGLLFRRTLIYVPAHWVEKL